MSETTKTCLDETGHLIVRELYRATERLGADAGLLSILGSWGDTLDDADILAMARAWNEMSCPCCDGANQ